MSSLNTSPNNPEIENLKLQLIRSEQEIRELRLQLQQTQEHEIQFQKVRKMASIISWDANILTGKLLLSEEASALFPGKNPNSITFDDLIDLIHPDDRYKFQTSYEISLRDNESFELVHRLVFPNGKIWTVSHNCMTFMATNGMPLRSTGLIQDITQQKHTQEELELRVEKRTKELKEINEKLNIQVRVREQVAMELQSSENRMREIMDNVVDGIITIDNKGIITSFNPAACKIFSYSANEVVGKNVNILMEEPDKSKHDSYIQKYLVTGQTNIIGVGREIKARKSDGTLFSASLAISALTLEDKIVFTGIIRDISSEKNAQKELIQAKEQAEKASQAKSDFLSRMSHELRTPLNAIIGFSQVMLREKKESLSQTQKEDVKRINDAGKHLLQLINEVLDLTRIESGKIDVARQPTNIFSVLEEVLTLTQVWADQQQVTINNEVNRKNIFALADRVYLKQVLLNLASNAIKFNKKGGTVTIKCESTPNVYISVEDTGIGVRKDRQNSIFEPFIRLHPEPNKIEGTGIGLAISKKLVGLMHGEISFSSVHGQGTCFSIKLPSSDPPELKNYEEKGSTAKISTEKFIPSIAKHKILYIEDNSLNVTVMEKIFRDRNNINLISAPQAKLGLELARAHIPDLILMDIHLPGMDGIEALKYLKLYKETKDIPTFAVSADAMESDIEKALKVGFNEYLTKPIDADHLLKAVDSYLNPTK